MDQPQVRRWHSLALILLAWGTMLCMWSATSAAEPQAQSREFHGSGPTTRCLAEKAVAGDWIVEAEIVSAGQPASAAFSFAHRPGTKAHLSFKIGSEATELYRHTSAGETRLASYPGAGPAPWKLKVWRRGAYYSFEINGKYLGFTFHPSGNLDGASVIPSAVEPHSTYLDIEFPSPGKYELHDLRISPISFGKRMQSPVIPPGPAGSWDQAEAFPGAFLEEHGTYYMYLNGTDWTSKALEGGGHTRTGLATSTDLINWKVDPRGPILGLGPQGSWDSTLVMVNGATRMKNGKFAVTYMGFNGTTWAGIGLATADKPEGPYTKYEGNPVLRTVPDSWETVIHEHTLYFDGDRYILFYTGFDGKNGDRGGLAYSQDLIHWTKDPSNPVFGTEGPGRWSSMHLRPRSLFRHSKYFYLFYEGAGTRHKFSPQEGGVEVKDQLVFDSVGLARSPDLHHWEPFPWNPAIAQTGEKSFDALWTGWPRAVLRPEGLFVFYAASDAWGFAKKQGRVHTGLMRIGYGELEQWGHLPDSDPHK